MVIISRDEAVCQLLAHPYGYDREKLNLQTNAFLEAELDRIQIGNHIISDWCPVVGIFCSALFVKSEQELRAHLTDCDDSEVQYILRELKRRENGESLSRL